MNSTEQAHNANVAALALCVRANIPVIVWGLPGEGKTSILRHIATSYRIPMTEVMVALHDPSDFTGLPVPDLTTGLTRFLPPEWVRTHCVDQGSGPSLLFFDEISSAPAQAQVAVMRIALERVVASYPLHPETRFVAAGNPVDIAVNGTDMAPPLANRFCHLTDWQTPQEAFAAGLVNGFTAPTLPMPDTSTVAATIAHAKALLAAFVMAKPGVLRATDNDRQTNLAFASPRSWTQAATAYGWAIASDADDSTIRVLLTGLVGAGAAAEFRAFANDQDLPNPEKLLADPTSWAPKTGRADQAWAAGSSVMAALHRDCTAARWVAAGDVLAGLADHGFEDVAVLYARTWVNTCPDRSVPMSAAATKALTPILTAMGNLRP